MLQSRIPSFCRRWLRVGILSTLVALGGAAWAHSDGITGYSGKQGSICTACHQGGKTPGVTLDGPTVLDAGATAIYTFRIDTDAAATGMNAATTDGVLAVNDDRTQLEDEEITHLHPVQPDAGVVIYSFSLKAPDFAGSVSLFAAGNAVDLSGDTDGDDAKGMKLDITVHGPPKPPVVEDSGTSLLPPPPPPPPPAVDAGSGSSKARPTSDSSDSGCGVGRTDRSSLPGGALLACLVALAAVGRTRRSKG